MKFGPAALCLLLCGSLSGCALFTSAAPEARSQSSMGNQAHMPRGVPKLELGPAGPDAEVVDAKGTPYRFANSVAVKLQPASHGVWTAWDAEHDRWRMDLHSTGAKSLNLHFSRMQLPAGARLLLYPPSQPEAALTLSMADNKPHGAYWTPQIAGDTLRLDLILPNRYARNVDLVLENVNIAWR